MRWLVWTRRLILIDCIICPVAAMMVTDPLSARLGIPVAMLFGVVLIEMGRRARYRTARLLGVLQCAGCAVGISLVTMMPLGPGFRWLSFLFVIGSILAMYFGGLWVWFHHPARDLRWQCDHCGYLLQGLVTPRCPECGLSFDAARIR